MYDEGFSRKSAEHRCSAWHVPQRPAKKGGAHDRTFCVLRHPAERLVSEFHHEAALMQGGLRPEFHHEASEAAYCDGDRFDAWVDRALDHAWRRKNYMDCHFVQQTEYAQFCDLFARLPSLESASFKDAHFGACPVASRDGYRDAVLCALRHVTKPGGKQTYATRLQLCMFLHISLRSEKNPPRENDPSKHQPKRLRRDRAREV